MKRTANPLPITFHGQTLFIVNHHGESYTPMKPIVEGMGLEWQRQRKKTHSTLRGT